MKAVRDTRRTLAAIAASSGEASGDKAQALCDLVFMIFLGLESARHAIRNLVEFEPEQAERTIVILLNELEAYFFLKNRFIDKEDPHHQRLMLRGAEYQHLVPQLICSVEAARATPYGPERVSPWEEAWELLPELRKRFEAV